MNSFDTHLWVLLSYCAVYISAKPLYRWIFPKSHSTDSKERNPEESKGAG